MSCQSKMFGKHGPLQHLMMFLPEYAFERAVAPASKRSNAETRTFQLAAVLFTT